MARPQKQTVDYFPHDAHAWLNKLQEQGVEPSKKLGEVFTSKSKQHKYQKEGTMPSEYSQKLKDPRWQKKRLEILERDEWTCQVCFDSESTLVVHHRRYLPNTDPWDYPDELLITLCENCHESERSERSGCEQDLLEMLRNHFFADDIHSLAAGFLKMELLYSHEVVASVYEWALSSPEIQRELIERYLLQLKEQRGSKKTD